MVVVCFCPCLTTRTKILPTSNAFIQIFPSKYITNIKLTSLQLHLITLISNILNDSIINYTNNSYISNLCYKCWCPASVDDIRTRDIITISQDYLGIPEFQYIDYMLYTVKFHLDKQQQQQQIIFLNSNNNSNSVDSNSNDNNFINSNISIYYSYGKWNYYSGIPDEKNLILINNINNTLFPSNSLCLSLLKKFWPDNLSDWIITLLLPWELLNLLIKCHLYTLAYITSPCWSCCSALRFKDEWKSDPNIKQTKLCLTTITIDIKCTGYPYQSIETKN